MTYVLYCTVGTYTLVSCVANRSRPIATLPLIMIILYVALTYIIYYFSIIAISQLLNCSSPETTESVRHSINSYVNIDIERYIYISIDTLEDGIAAVSSQIEVVRYTA